jgi:NTP pyrophosphatase (non-canonical NTP hydrolase)
MDTPGDSLDPRVKERLLVLIEECAEVQQAVSKIFRFGVHSCYPNHYSNDNITELHQEVGDVIAMIDSLVELGFLDRKELDLAVERKREKLKIWIHNQ